MSASTCTWHQLAHHNTEQRAMAASAALSIGCGRRYALDFHAPSSMPDNWPCAGKAWQLAWSACWAAHITACSARHLSNAGASPPPPDEPADDDGDGESPKTHRTTIIIASVAATVILALVLYGCVRMCRGGYGMRDFRPRCVTCFCPAGLYACLALQAACHAVAAAYVLLKTLQPVSANV